ncbi:MAG TPA: SpoIVB peptidase S55 domain-containing protein [Candidatus Brocadiia bacterium]|nr:SpoIVB peptidase S55 domain-containing protein [Candidatus Brocadiia bacterium]
MLPEISFRRSPAAVLLLIAMLASLSESRLLAQQIPLTMPLSDIKPGMKGKGRTVFRGSVIEEFDFEVIGMLRAQAPRRRFILIRMAGGPIDKAGIIAGMSGSPCYIDGKLIGAVSRGYTYSKEPLAGVTPIEDMLEILPPEAKPEPEKPVPPAPQPTQPAAPAPAQPEAKKIPDEKNAPNPQSEGIGGDRAERGDGATFRLRDFYDIRDELVRLRAMLQETQTGGSEFSAPSPENMWAIPFAHRLAGNRLSETDLAPIQVPMTVAGASAEALRRIIPMARGMNLMPVQAAATADDVAAVALPDLEPGSPVGASFVSGDISMSGTGTVTTRSGKTILAFGHSMMEFGPTDIPMTAAIVQAVMPSVQWSFKLSMPGPEVGRFITDMRPGCVGIVGEMAKQFPVRVEVEGFRNEKADFQVLDNEYMTPFMTGMAVETAVWSLEGFGDDMVHQAESAIYLKGRPAPLKYANVFCGPDPAESVMDLIVSPLYSLYSNPFVKPEIEKVEFKLKLEKGNIYASLKEISVPKREYAPGEECEVTALVQPYRREGQLYKLRFRIPNDAVPGSDMLLTVCDPRRNLYLDLETAPGKFEARNFEQMLELMQIFPRMDQIVVRAILPGGGLTFQGREYPALPPSVAQVMSTPLRTGMGISMMSMVLKTDAHWIIRGQRDLRLKIIERSR